MYFDIYFSVEHGFIIDFPFLDFKLSTAAIAVIATAVIALRVRKVLKNRKRAQIEMIEEFESIWK